MQQSRNQVRVHRSEYALSERVRRERHLQGFRGLSCTYIPRDLEFHSRSRVLASRNPGVAPTQRAQGFGWSLFLGSWSVSTEWRHQRTKSSYLLMRDFTGAARRYHCCLFSSLRSRGFYFFIVMYNDEDDCYKLPDDETRKVVYSRNLT